MIRRSKVAGNFYPPNGKEEIVKEEIVTSIPEAQKICEEIAELAGGALVLPSAVRRETPLPDGFKPTPEVEARIRELAKNICIGREDSITPENVGLPSDCPLIIEGGTIFKTAASLHEFLDERYTGPMIFIGNRGQIFNPEIIQEAIERGMIPPETVIREVNEVESILLALDQFGFIPDQTVDLQEFTNPPELNDEGKYEGSIDPQKIGMINNRDVYIIDPPLQAELKEGHVSVRQVLPPDESMRIVSKKFNQMVGFVTSTTYYFTRLIKLGSNEHGHVVAYGQKALRRAKNENPQEPSKVDLNQILGEVRLLYDKIKGLSSNKS